MKHLVKMTCIGFGAILLCSGCATPEQEVRKKYYANKHTLVFVEGKPFRVPIHSGYVTYHKPVTYKNTEIDKEKTENYSLRGLDCRIGDIMWLIRKEMRMINNTTGRVNMQLQYDLVADLARRGGAGCLHPLSNMEYEFHRGKELDKSANERALLNYRAATEPLNKTSAEVDEFNDAIFNQ